MPHLWTGQEALLGFCAPFKTHPSLSLVNEGWGCSRSVAQDTATDPTDEDNAPALRPAIFVGPAMAGTAEPGGR